MAGLIVFFGPDGSGKSTQVDLLTDCLRSRGLKVRRVWIRSPHTVAYLVSRILLRIGFCRTISNPYGVKQEMLSLPRNATFKLIWSLLELISVRPLIMFKVDVPIFLGYTVIAERYVLDTIVNLAYYANDLDFVHSQVAKLFLRLVPKNASIIHLDSNYATIVNRRGHWVDSSDFIEFQRSAYEILRNSVDAHHLSTSDLDVSQTSKEILRILEAENSDLLGA